MNSEAVAAQSPKTFAEFKRLFPDETACRTYLVGRRWPAGVTCPRCGNTQVCALRIHWMIGSGSYRTAWYLAHRLRAGLADPEFRRLVGAA